MLTKSTKYQIHTFCDASEEGYCVAVYIRIKNGSEITTNFTKLYLGRLKIIGMLMNLVKQLIEVWLTDRK